MTNFTDIRDFLRAHCARYPELALQDVFKALYQSAFGCEHLIADPSAAADYIRAEAARSGDRISELVEMLSGDYCRVHLGILQDGLNAETFARLFALSARHEECGREKLEAMLTALQEEVLLPLREGKPVDYRRFDCATFTIAPPQRIKEGTLNIVEGAYSMHPDLALYYDLSVFLSISAEKQRERILKRNAPAHAKQFFDRWIPFEQRYFDALDVRNRCDLILSADD